MTSAALTHWDSGRRARLDELFAAHVAVGGSGPGRRTATEQLNWSLALRLAAEFQGFARDLHDEAADVVLSRANLATPALMSLLNNLLTLNRKLSVANATKSTLQQDFARFGFQVLDEIVNRYVRGPRWLEALEALNTARNGIAHSDEVKIERATGGSPLTLTKVRAWDGSMRSLARALDSITADKLATMTGGRPPW